jgi:hypothetical protein
MGLPFRIAVLGARVDLVASAAHLDPRNTQPNRYIELVARGLSYDLRHDSN